MGPHTRPQDRLENARKRLRETTDEYTSASNQKEHHVDRLADLFHHLADFVDTLLNRRGER